MAKKYIPLAGTVIYSVLQFLKEHPGREFTTAELVEATGNENMRMLKQCSDPAIKAGVLKMRASVSGTGKRVLFWSLGDGVQPGASDGQDQDEEKPIQLWTPAPPPPQKTSEPPIGEPIQFKEPLRTPSALLMAKWSDGRAEIHRGAAFLILTKEETEQLLGFLGGRQ